MNAIITDNLTKIAALCEKFEVRQLDVFGSAARGEFEPQASDVDLLVAFFEEGPGTNYSGRFFAFEEAMSDMLGVRADVHSMTEPRRPSRIWDEISVDREMIYAASRVAATSGRP